jgi:hypothetical protein
MTKLLCTTAILLLLPAAAMAQTDMSCGDYLKADAQMMASMSAADKALLTADPTAAALDRKMKAYCTKNPKAPTSEAMQKAMTE